MDWLKKLIARRKLLVVIILAVSLGGYWAYKHFSGSGVINSYVTAVVSKGTLVTSVGGTGQISASNQVEVKAKVSGQVVMVKVQSGQQVKAGDLLAQLDASEAYKTVRDAETNLETARLSLAKLKQPVDPLALLQAENSLVSAQENKLQIEQDIIKAYDDAFTAVANTFLNLPTVITKLYTVLYSNEISSSEITVGGTQNNSAALLNSVNSDDRDKIQNLITSAQSDYLDARSKYDINFNDYRDTNRTSNQATIESLLTETLATTRAMAQSIKSQSNLLDAWADSRSQRNLSVFTQVKSYQTSLASYTSQVNSNLSSLISSQQALQDNKSSLVSAQRTIAERTQSLADLKAGTDPLDIRSQELSVQQRLNTLQDARENLADYAIRAPFDGVVAALNVKKGDEVSLGTSLATIITAQRLAEITVNEVDVAKIKVGQKVILTFDAVSDLSLTGQVAEVDTLGTVAQGVVSYTVKISFDTQDDRIKPGMSTSTSIIIDVRQDVLLVPNAAVKSQTGQSSYVQVLNNGLPQKQVVQIGLSNDSQTEIISGLEEGVEVVTQTITSGSTTSTTNSGGLPGLGGGAIRVGGFR